MRRCHIGGLSGLGLVATLGANVASASAGSKTATSVTLEASTALAACTVSTTAAGTTTTARSVGISVVSIGARSTLLHRDLFGSNLVGVSANGSSITSRLRKLDEGAVLKVKQDELV